MSRRIAYILICCVILLAVPAALASSLRNSSAQALGPIGGFLVRKNIQASNFLASIRQIPDLRTQNQSLETQLIDLQRQLIDKESVTKENDALRKELGVSGTDKSLSKAFVHVILQGSNPLDPTFTVDAGSAQGVKVGQPAVYEGALVGRVISVRENSSVIRSIVSGESRIQARVAGNQEKGLLVGEGNAVYLSDITQGVDISLNSVVETSGLGGSLPQGLLIGQVSEVESKKSDLSQKFLVKIPKDPAALDSMFILLIDAQ